MNRHREEKAWTIKKKLGHLITHERGRYLFASQHSPSGIMENNHAQQIICCQTLMVFFGLEDSRVVHRLVRSGQQMSGV